MTDQKIARINMVESQVRPNQVNDRRVIAAMRILPRENFAPAGAMAYADADICLGGGRYLLAPMLIARLAQLVMADNPAHVLVVGAGAGYGAAVIAACGPQIVALEEDAKLLTNARAAGVERVAGPLARGWPAGGPYDVIFIEGAVTAIPALFAAQLVPGGRVVTVLAAGHGLGALGQAVLAEASAGAGGFAMKKMFDATARLLPAFQPAPAFTF